MIHDNHARMIPFPRWIPALAILAVIHYPAQAQSAAPPVAPPAWPVTSAPARLDLDVTPAPQPCRIGVVDLYLPNPNWVNQPIRVYTDTGVAVGCDLLWITPNGPATLIFDAQSNAKKYQVYFGSNYPVMHVTDAKAGVWIESRQGPPQLMNTLPDMLKAWNASTTVNGRAITSSIWEGGNRFGPQGNLLTHFQGWFDLAVPARLQFGVVSVDSAFLLVDGKEVAEWPGHHGLFYGPAGPPQGAVDLAAGPHSLDYYYSYVREPGDDPLRFACCLAVNGGPFAYWTMVTPDTHLFRPFVRAHANAYELQSDSPGAAGTAPSLAIDWANGEQSVIYTDIPDIGFIAMRFRCLLDHPGTVTWTFDDGTTAQGATVDHLFARPGARTVHVSLVDDGKEIGSLTQTVAVHPDWADPNKLPLLRPAQEAAILARDPATLSASDLVSCFAMFGNYLKSDELFKFVPAMTTKMNDVADADLPYVKNGALLLTHDDWVHSAEEIQLLRALVDRCGKGTPSPQTAVVGGEARLALARLVFKTSDNLNDVKALLSGIDPSALTNDEPRVRQILNADLALAAGDVPGARQQYEALTGQPSGPDARSSIRQIARIEQARAFIDRQDFDAAEDSLNEVAWQSPIAKLSPDWALTRLRLYQEENQPIVAYLWAKRLLPVITETGRSELLYRLTDLAFAQNDNALAQKTLEELLSKHPYSEEAAQAKEKWPGKG